MTAELPTGWEWRGAHPEEGDLLTRVGAARGLSGQQLVNFLTPDFYANWHDPKLLSDLTAAVDRLARAIERQESILIMGDYDADGIPATAVAVRALRSFGAAHVDAIIPTRDQGYGLTGELVDEIKKRHPDLLLTVDTGASSVEEVAALTAAGIEVIVTDHHEVPATPPDCLMVNPKRSDSQYPNRDLAGCGVIYKVMWALAEKTGRGLTDLKYLLDLVALSTMADLMPLTPENRSLVVFGRQVMQRTKNLGLRALLLAGEVAPGQVDYRHLSFFLAPRLNAISRLGLDRSERHDQWGSLALALLLTTDTAEADRIARRLHEINDSRRTTVTEWQAAVDELPHEAGQPIVAYLPDAPVGLLGLIAGSLMERHGVPALIMALDANGQVRGSARLPHGYPPLPEVFASLDGLLLRFGGHNEAGGWSLRPEQLADFTTAVASRLQPISDQAHDVVAIDALLRPEEATVETARRLSTLAPFGPGNREPLLAISGRLVAQRSLGASGAHVKFTLEEYPGLSVVWFNHGQAALPGPGAMVHLAGELTVNVWREPEPQLVVNASLW